VLANWRFCKFQQIIFGPILAVRAMRSSSFVIQRAQRYIVPSVPEMKQSFWVLAYRSETTVLAALRSIISLRLSRRNESAYFSK
jgi:hypothetical protein